MNRSLQILSNALYFATHMHSARQTRTQTSLIVNRFHKVRCILLINLWFRTIFANAIISNNGTEIARVTYKRSYCKCKDITGYRLHTHRSNGSLKPTQSLPLTFQCRHGSAEAYSCLGRWVVTFVSECLPYSFDMVHFGHANLVRQV